MLCAKFVRNQPGDSSKDWNWLSTSGEEDFEISSAMNVFSLFGNYLPLEKGGALHLQNPLYT